MIDGASLKNILTKYGNRFSIDKQAEPFYGVISPKTKVEAIMQENIQRIGAVLENECVLIYPSDEHRLSSGIKIFDKYNRCFYVKTSDLYSICDNPLYNIAIIREEWKGTDNICL